jgi:hypothetical protein
MTTNEHQEWCKSSYSNTGNGCVEVDRTRTVVRDSKNPGGPVLAVAGLCAPFGGALQALLG